MRGVLLCVANVNPIRANFEVLLRDVFDIEEGCDEFGTRDIAFL